MVGLTKWFGGTVVVGLLPFLALALPKFVAGHSASIEYLLKNGSLFVLASSMAGAGIAELLGSISSGSTRFVLGKIGAGIGALIVVGVSSYAFEAVLTANAPNPFGIAATSVVVFCAGLLAAGFCIALAGA